MSYWVLEKKAHPSSPRLVQPKPAGRSIQTTLSGFRRRRPSSSPRASSSAHGRGSEGLARSKADEELHPSFAESSGQHAKRKRLPSPPAAEIEEDPNALNISQGHVFHRVPALSIGESCLYESGDSEANKSHEPVKRKVKRRRKRWDDAACAPAISPKKRKSLIEQSAKDIAAQQHSLRAREVLSPIDNTHESYSHRSPGSRKDQGSAEAVHSPLRQGFSLVQVGTGSDIDSDSDSAPSSPLLAKSSSPVKQASDLRGPGISTGVLVLETQLAGAGLGQPETPVDGEIEQLTEASQTATEESWPGSQSQSQAQAYDSNTHILASPADTDAEEGDLTIVPDSQIRPDPSATAHDEETQVLSWDEDEVGASQCANTTISSSRTQRKTKAWREINRLWFPYLTEVRESKAKKPDQAKQSSLDSFGYRTKTKDQRKERSPSPMSEGEDLPSDLDDLAPTNGTSHGISSGVKPLSFADDESVGQAVRTCRDSQEAGAASSSSETQSLPWDDDLSNRSSDDGSADAISVPSDTGLDTQMRHFFAQL